jgi:hypothetical protein
MIMLFMQTRKIFSIIALATLACGPIWSIGPLDFDGDPAVSIYRDYDDGLFGRSIYRGVIFSVKLDSFGRYRTLPVGHLDGLTAYLVSSRRGNDIAAGSSEGLVLIGPAPRYNLPRPTRDPEKWLYRYNRDGIKIVFSLEAAPEDLYNEIQSTYFGKESLIEEVSESYRDGYILRIHEAENLYRPQIAKIDYEDILVAAALIADIFQPLWGIHDGNGLGSDWK